MCLTFKAVTIHQESKFVILLCWDNHKLLHYSGQHSVSVFPVSCVAAVTKIAQLSWFFYWSGRERVISWAACQLSGGKTLGWGGRNFLSQCNSTTCSSPHSKNLAGSPCCSPISLNSAQCTINTLHLVLQSCSDKYIYYEAVTCLIFTKSPTFHMLFFFNLFEQS